MSRQVVEADLATPARSTAARRSPARRSPRGPIDASARLGVPVGEALASLYSEGKAVFPCEIELTDSEGQRVATATIQWQVRLNQPVAAEAD
jgi:hypothetical protein